MKITREKLIALWQLSNRLINTQTSVKFHYLLLKNKRLLDPEVESLQTIQKPSEDYEKFNEARVELCKEHADKDEQGNPKVTRDPVNGTEQFSMLENKEAFDKAVKELQETHKEAIDEAEQKQEDFMALLNEEIELELITIPLSIMPKELVGRDVDLLFDIIDGEA